MGNDGVKGNGKGWQIGEIALPGKGKEIGRYWCDKKVGYWAREEKEMCPGGATCLPLLGNVLALVGQRACPTWATCLPKNGTKNGAERRGCVTTSQTYRTINRKYNDRK